MSQDTFKELYVRGELGETRQASHDEILSAARSIMSRKVRRGTSMSSPKLVKDFLTTKLGTLEHETFCVILLDKRHRLIEYVELFRGTIDGALYLAMRL
jgi:DNA repair protein RadC